MDGWMDGLFHLPGPLAILSDMQVTTTICILVALITVVVTFLTGELYVSPRSRWSAFALSSDLIFTVDGRFRVTTKTVTDLISS